MVSHKRFNIATSRLEGLNGHIKNHGNDPISMLQILVQMANDSYGRGNTTVYPPDQILTKFALDKITEICTNELIGKIMDPNYHTTLDGKTCQCCYFSENGLPCLLQIMLIRKAIYQNTNPTELDEYFKSSLFFIICFP